MMNKLLFPYPFYKFISVQFYVVFTLLIGCEVLFALQETSNVNQFYKNMEISLNIF